MKPGKNCRIILAIALIMDIAQLFGGTLALGQSAVRLPLLQEGKHSLYQRVISHPGAMVSTYPGEEGKQSIRSFTPLYVYSRDMADGEEWLEVSPASRGADQVGWIRQSQWAGGFGW